MIAILSHDHPPSTLNPEMPRSQGTPESEAIDAGTKRGTHCNINNQTDCTAHLKHYCVVCLDKGNKAYQQGAVLRFVEEWVGHSNLESFQLP
jgi:hypothetical protein